MTGRPRWRHPATRRAAGLLIGLLIAATAAGCSSGSTGSTGSPTTSSPGTTPTSGSPTTAPSNTVIPYFLRGGLVGAGARITPSGDAHVEAVQALVKGPTPADEAAGLTSAVPTNVTINKLDVKDGVATIDLSRTFETRETQPQVAQVVFTLTQFPDITKVKFLIDGQDNGATGVPPVGREAFPRFAPDVLLDAPTPGSSSPSSVKVSGDLSTAYSSFAYRITGPAGAVLAEGTVTAKFGSGRKRFDQAVDAKPGSSGPAVFVVEPPAGSKQPGFSVPFTIAA